MKKALQVLAGPIILAALITSSSSVQGSFKLSEAIFDDEGGPATPSTPDSPLCLPDLPCEPDTPNLR
jgi:hypothetical protein